MRPKPQTLLYTLLVAVLIVGSAIGALAWQRSRVITALTVQLASQQPGEATAAVEQLAAMADPPLSILVVAAASDRREVSQAGQAAIAGLIDRWKRELEEDSDHDTVAAHAAELAAQLARTRHAFAVRHYPWLGTTTHEIVRLANRCPGENLPLVAMYCDEVAAVIGEKTKPGAAVASNGELYRFQPRYGQAAVDVTPLAAPTRAPLEREFAEIPAEPLLPQATVTEESTESMTASGTPITDRAAHSDSTRSEFGELPMDDIDAAAAPQRLVGQGDIAGDVSPPGELNGQPDWAMPLLRMVPAQPAGSATAREIADHAERGEVGDGIPTRELLAQLASQQVNERREAERLLAKRGFTRVPAELVKQYLSTDPQQRRNFGERVMKESGLDRRPWLCLLADDEDAEIRLAAVTLMATSADPVLVEKAWQVSIHDRDPRIADLALRLRDRRGNALRR